MNAQTPEFMIAKEEMDDIVRQILDAEKLAKNAATGAAAGAAAAISVEFFMDTATNEIILMVFGGALAAPILIPLASPVLSLLSEGILSTFKETLSTAREKMEDMEFGSDDDAPAKSGSLEDAIARIRARSKNK